MKRSLALVLVALLVVSVTYAGDTVVPKTKAGNKAVLFTLGGLANLGAGTYGGGIGGKYYFADKWAGRLGIGFTTSTETTKNPASTVPAGQKSERDQTSTTFTVAPAVLYTLATTGAVNAYTGAQIYFVSSTTSTDDPGFDADSKVETSSTGFGAGLLLGVEWFPWENISFGAEYTFGFLTESGDRTNTVNGTSTKSDGPSTTSIGTAAVNGANLTVSVFF
jgi:hypothetical protein